MDDPSLVRFKRGPKVSLPKMLCGNVDFHYATATSTATDLIFNDVHTIMHTYKLGGRTLILEEEIHNSITIMEQHDFDICNFMISGDSRLFCWRF